MDPIRNKPWCLFRTNILICSTKTLQLCYKPESRFLRSIRFLLGLWHLSWRPWWWESTVNRLSFFPELLLYKIIIDFEKNPCRGSFVLEVYRKKQSTTAASCVKPGLHTEMQFHKLLNWQQPTIFTQQWMPASIPIPSTGVGQSSGTKGDR